ncbi:MAG: DUF3574 domain-containing protein [Gammaproteobacteria bacterium]|nr:DUF3574 domain-containing protein [Gammaproteobacteria bacterium]
MRLTPAKIIDAIREDYKKEFKQQSVLRTDSIDCVSF